MTTDEVAAPIETPPYQTPTGFVPEASGRKPWLVPAIIGAVVLIALVVVSINLGSDDGEEPQRTTSLLGGTATATPEAATPSIAGVWDSNFGPVTFKHRNVDEDLGAVKLTGSWEQGEGKHGKITGGRFNPSKGTVEIEYVETWSEVEGTAVFELSADGLTLTGTYDQPGAKGAWVLSRLANS